MIFHSFLWGESHENLKYYKVFVGESHENLKYFKVFRWHLSYHYIDEGKTYVQYFKVFIGLSLVYEIAQWFFKTRRHYFIRKILCVLLKYVHWSTTVILRSGILHVGKNFRISFLEFLRHNSFFVVVPDVWTQGPRKRGFSYRQDWNIFSFSPEAHQKSYPTRIGGKLFGECSWPESSI